MTRDSRIQQDVLEELRWDTRVGETEVGVAVNAGVVVLSGTVSSWGKRIAAQEAAHRVRGVVDVANDLLVKPAGSKARTDVEIAHAVRHALEWDVAVPDERIRSTVSRGWVVLEGEVDFPHEREDAERAIRNLSGVVGISNQLEVSLRETLRHNVRQSIESALQRQTDREAKRLTISVKDGEVVVSGEARSRAEQQAILGAIRGTRGVRSVKSALLISGE